MKINLVSLRMVRESIVEYKSLAMKEGIGESKHAAPIFREFCEGYDVETFWALYLDAKNPPTALHMISKGGLTSTNAHPRDVLKGAVLSNACSIIVAHNHPSGDPDPSPDDRQLTDRLREAAEILGIKLLDHIIIGAGGRYYSFTDNRESKP